jgi:hypothetical protein
MAKLTVKAGSTSRREYVFILDSASTTGAGKTGLAWNTAGWKAYYVRPGGSATSISLAVQTVTGAFSGGGFVEVDGTNMPGVYRFDVPDAVFAASAEKAIVMLSGPTGVAPVVLEYDLIAYDPQDTVRLGLTAIPNVASGSAGAIITSGTGTAQLSVASGAVTVGTINSNVITATSIATDAITAAKLASDAGDEIADAILKRNVSNVEASLNTTNVTVGGTSYHNLGTVILANLENSISGTTLTIKKTDATTLTSKTLTTNASAIPITGID